MKFIKGFAIKLMKFHFTFFRYKIRCKTVLAAALCIRSGLTYFHSTMTHTYVSLEMVTSLQNLHKMKEILRNTNIYICLRL